MQSEFGVCTETVNVRISANRTELIWFSVQSTVNGSVHHSVDSPVRLDFGTNPVNGSEQNSVNRLVRSGFGEEFGQRFGVESSQGF